MKDFEQWKW